jgi:hypothetical protein
MKKRNCSARHWKIKSARWNEFNKRKRDSLARKNSGELLLRCLLHTPSAIGNLQCATAPYCSQNAAKLKEAAIEVKPKFAVRDKRTVDEVQAVRLLCAFVVGIETNRLCVVHRTYLQRNARKRNMTARIKL